MRTVGLLVVAVAALGLSGTPACAFDFSKDVVVVGWAMFVKDHCPEWTFDLQRAGSALGPTTMSRTESERHVSQAVQFSYLLEAEGDTVGQCRKAAGIFGPRALGFMYRTLH